MDPNLDLALVKISHPFVVDDWTTAIQKVNLPWSKAVCEKYLEKDCHLFLGTEQREDGNDPATVVAVVVGDGQGNLQSLKNQVKRPALMGSGVVGWFEKVNFLVGIYVGNANTTVGSWKDGAETGSVISICPFLDQIRQVADVDK